VNKKALPIVVIIILLLLVGGWYSLSQKKTSNLKFNGSNTNNEKSISTNLKDLFAKGVAQSCTYSSDAGSGKVYVAGGSMRGDFETKVEGKNMTSHMIVKDNTSYIWTDDQKTGLSMAFDPNTIDTSDSGNTQVQGQAADMTANYDYKCGAWVVDSSQFTPPADVTFSSFDIPTSDNQTSPQEGGGSSSQCSYCNALTGDDKTQCLTALKCN